MGNAIVALIAAAIMWSVAIILGLGLFGLGIAIGMALS